MNKLDTLETTFEIQQRLELELASFIESISFYDNDNIYFEEFESDIELSW